MRGNAYVARFALAAAAFFAFAAPSTAETDPFGGLPATYRVRESIVLSMRFLVPGPDPRIVRRGRDVERMVFSGDGSVTMGSRRRPTASLSGTYTIDSSCRAVLVADEATLAKLARQFERLFREATGVGNWHVTASAEPAAITFADGGQTGTGQLVISLSAFKGRIAVESTFSVKCRVRRID